MVRVVLSVIVLVLIATLVVLNIGTTASFNFFGRTFATVPVIAIAIGGFVLGVLYSFLYFLMRTVARYRRTRMKDRNARLEERVRTAEAAAQRPAADDERR